MRKMVQEYVQGCAVCQANKIITHRNKPPLLPIGPEDDAQPFEMVAMDLIVKLPVTGTRERMGWRPLDRSKFLNRLCPIVCLCTTPPSFLIRTSEIVPSQGLMP
jgi:hypothetical protein